MAILDRKPTNLFVSEIDQYLAEFDKTHELSKSQRDEIKKHQRVFTLRDNPESQISDDQIWEQF